MDKNGQKGSFLTGFLFSISEHLTFFEKQVLSTLTEQSTEPLQRKE